jgi:hypothetical protein
MNPTPEMAGAAEPTREEILEVLFSNLVMSLCQEAYASLGQMPHPMTGETAQDLERAQFVIGQLEVLLIKTKGNLTPQESEMLKQNVSRLRMLFVEIVENPQPAGAPDHGVEPGMLDQADGQEGHGQTVAPRQQAPSHEPRETSPPPQRAPSALGSAPAASNANQEEPKKRYSKKY